MRHLWKKNSHEIESIEINSLKIHSEKVHWRKKNVKLKYNVNQIKGHGTHLTQLAFFSLSVKYQRERSTPSVVFVLRTFAFFPLLSFFDYSREQVSMFKEPLQSQFGQVERQEFISINWIWVEAGEGDWTSRLGWIKEFSLMKFVANAISHSSLILWEILA